MFSEWSENWRLYRRNPNGFRYSFSWRFDWNELKKSGVEGLSGHITVRSLGEYFETRTIDVDLTESPQVVEEYIDDVVPDESYTAIFEYHLLPCRLPIEEEEAFYDEMFFPSKLNDTILVIEEKRLHVSSVFLSYHSDFFEALFSSNFKEGQMEEIPIKDVSYADFGLLMSTIYPKTVFPNDKTVEKLLELADRFLIPSVIGHVEYHLLHNTRINSEKIIWMADKYGMPTLFKKCMGELNTVEEAKKLHTSPEYKKLSKDAKAEILDILMKMI